MNKKQLSDIMRGEEVRTAYEQLEQQHEWAVAQGFTDLADAYHQGLAYLANKLVDLTMGVPS